MTVPSARRLKKIRALVDRPGSDGELAAALAALARLGAKKPRTAKQIAAAEKRREKRRAAELAESERRRAWMDRAQWPQRQDELQRCTGRTKPINPRSWG